MNTMTPFEPDRDDAFEALRQALTVEPSANLAARVRERVRLEPVGSPSAWWRRPAFAGAAALAAVLVSAIAWQLWPSSRPGANATLRSAIESQQSSSAPSPQPLAMTPSMRSEVAKVASPPRSLARARSVSDLAAGRPAYESQAAEVIVSADERTALDRFLLEVRAGRASVPQPQAGREASIDPMPEIAPIEIPLLKPISPLDAGSAAFSGSKQR
jgi:hypothetical protein